MVISPKEKDWLQRECVNPIIVSALKRINLREKIATAKTEEKHIISAAIIFALNRFACNGIEFDLGGNNIKLYAYAQEIVDHFNKKDIEYWYTLLTDIQQYCFREMQALQIVKLEYTALSHDELKKKILSKIAETYTPPNECNGGKGMGEAEMIARMKETTHFVENCKIIRMTQTPL